MISAVMRFFDGSARLGEVDDRMTARMGNSRFLATADPPPSAKDDKPKKQRRPQQQLQLQLQWQQQRQQRSLHCASHGARRASVERKTHLRGADRMGAA
jgi:hypothetical protein